MISSREQDAADETTADAHALNSYVTVRSRIRNASDERRYSNERGKVVECGWHGHCGALLAA
jgi:hypothetical protein